MKTYLLIGSIGLTVLASGCSMFSEPPILRQADAFVNGEYSVGEQYIKYVKDDSKLNESEKQIRIDNVTTFRKVIEAAKE